MDNGLHSVIETVDEYSYIVNAKKVTIGKGERFVQLKRPNPRWVLVCRQSSDQQKLFLPVRIVTPVQLNHLTCVPKELSTSLSFTASDLAIQMAMGNRESLTDIPSSDLPPSLADSGHSIQIVRSYRKSDSSSITNQSNDSNSADQTVPVMRVKEESRSVPVDRTEIEDRKPWLEEAQPDHCTSNENADSLDPHPTVITRWRRHVDDGLEVFINTQTNEKWAPAIDDKGKKYYYEVSTRQSVWELEDFDVADEVEQPSAGKPIASLSSMNAYLTASSTDDRSQTEQMRASDERNDSDSWFSSDDEIFTPFPSADPVSQSNQSIQQVTASKKEKSKSEGRSSKSSKSRTPILNSLNRGKSSSKTSTSREDEGNNQSDSGETRSNRRQIAKEHISGPEQNKLTNFERREIVNRTKFMEQGRPVTKDWSEAFMVLSGAWLFLYRDIKAAQPRQGKKTSSPFGKPEVRFHVQQLVVSDATVQDTSRKSVIKLEVEGADGSNTVYLVQLPENVIGSWKAAFQYAKELLNDEDRLTPILARNTIRHFPRPPSKIDANILTKLRDFFRHRPSAETLRARGILKNEPVFASTLVQVCEQEQSEVPRFVVCAIRAIEARGLDHLGLYRVSANTSEVQKLRCCVNQYNYSLNSEKWSMNVLADGLKLFFRELKEPLFTFDLFPKISQLFRSQCAAATKLDTMRELIFSMPAPHIATARVLFHHLHRVLQHSAVNQMHAQKLTIIFGPNLLRSDTEVENLDMLTKVQVPCVEFCLHHVVELFGPVVPPPVVV